MTKLYIDDTATTTVFAANTVYTVTVASAASDTSVTNSGTGNSLINTSVGGAHVLNSVAAGANVTITSDSAGTLTIAATEDNLSNNTTTDLPEGTNQYFTDARADARIYLQTGTNLNLSSKYTDQLAEGGTNLYFTDARVMTSLATVSADIIPDGHKTRDLGSTGNAWKSVYVGDGSLYIDGTKVLGSDATGQIDFTTDVAQNLNFQAGGTITMLSDGQVTTLGDSTVNLGPSVSGGVINARGTLEAPDIHIGSLELESGLINSTGTSQNLEIRSNGTGYVHFNTADVYIGSPITTAVKIDGTSITTTAGNLTISATGTVDVAGHYTSAETDTAITTATGTADSTAESKDVARMVTSDAYADQAETDAIASAESKDAVRATAANTYADAAVSVLTSGASAAFDTLVEIKTLMDSGDTTLTNSIAALNHDTLSGFVANEHIDWSVTGNTVHADNYTNTDTVYTAFNTDFDTRLGTKDTANLTEGTNLYHTDARAISAVEGESTLDLTGTVKVGDMEMSSYTAAWGEDFGEIKATGTNQNLMLTADDGTGYFLVKSPNIYLGAASGVKITNAASSDTTISGFGYSGEGLNITADLITSTKGVINGTSTGYTVPVLELAMDVTGWAKTQLMLKDSVDDVVSVSSIADTGNNQYQLGFTFDPNNTKPRTNVGGTGQTYAGDYGLAINKNYNNQDAISMDMKVFGANDGFNIVAMDDSNGTNWSGDGRPYNPKPIRLKGEQVELWTNGTKRLSSTDAGTKLLATTTSTSDNNQPLQVVNQLDWDHSGEGNNLNGHGTNVSFTIKAQNGDHLDVAQNLCKIVGVTTGGSAGSASVTDYHGEYTLTTGERIAGVEQGGLNCFTANKNFAQATKELRITNTPRNSGSTNLSGLYLTYDGTETGSASAKIQLNNDTGSGIINLMTLEETRVTQEVIHKQYKASSDPTGENGDMYYNDSTHKFRGYANGSWTDLH